MKTSIATVSISGTLVEKLEAIAAAGFDGIEIFEQDFIAHDGPPREVGEMVRDHGLSIDLFQPFRDFEGLPGALRRKAFDRAEHKFDLMQDLGADLVLICSSCHPEALGGIDRAADDLAELGERAAKRGIRIGYEALAWGRHVNDHRDAWEIVRRAGHDQVGLILDSFHTLARKIDPDTIRQIPGDRIFYVQLADAPQIEMDLLYWSRHFRNMPGEGDLDCTGFMRAVMATGYDGPLSLEIFNDQFRGGNTRMLAEDGHRSILTLMDDVRRQEPELTFQMPPMPARVPAAGVGFVEFATRGDEAKMIEASLSACGFQFAGRHRNKDVTLWQQGGARVVLNRETTGYAASAWNARGSTVCDIGLEVASAEDALARAAALGAEPFSQGTGPGEIDIPAVRGLAGSILHFLDAGTAGVWEAEFDLVENRDAGVGIIGIDHIAQTMSYADMLNWTLFYTSILDTEKTPVIDVVDPNGLVKSQAISSPEGGLRITLNGADSHRTLAGRILSENFGAPLQHIAFRTDDMLATAAALFERGFETLPITQNYYADLAARFDLPKDVLADFERYNILYEEDAEGAFLQLYSADFVGGAFFEIVERRGGYRGYGAPNAPFRIAAQKRRLRPNSVPLK
ncbi:sugar phosphate isomerase/epimerase and 4-hydroxyphenylpyruvate domain-containing protein [Salipiger sp. IMCC34102]|uniref:bifunctional sugar phosphate isomerase/epimerase/4-hydroxyphenylpyruvate dioxygenase family protein n=1 Tax=Salipiger sp. IMCC34102 TaxID=2510647 RepID=UPI00101B6F31|nr:sugar phosphate isomerase/epimerase and 4-hydroxyphenylpyruvate domain-containing protein [Salipiger sp. IMCC34102]RYH04441.1 sugar phosphate isomerase/epimerase and 4-hydroxyphenylpyruvate domain-containing protein [Salipiger sp. IMCC34102]